MPNKNMKIYLKVERFLVDDDYELIEMTEYFEDLSANDD
jgi:hypothetical protein